MEDTERTQRTLVIRLQQIIAPGQRRGERAVARQRRIPIGFEARQLLLELAIDRLDANRRGARRSHLQRQRHAVEPPAQAGDDRQFVGRQLLAEDLIAIGEELGRCGVAQRALLGNGKGEQLEHMLLGQGEGHLRGGEDADIGNFGEQCTDDAGSSAAHVLAIVEDQHCLAGPQVFDDRFERAAAGTKRHGESLDQDALDELATAERSEIDHPDAAVYGAQGFGHGDGKRGFADPTRPQDTDQPVLVQQARHGLDLTFARHAVGTVAADIAGGAGGTGAQRLLVLDRLRADILVATAMHGSDEARPQRLAQRRHVDLQGVFLDHNARPHRIEQRRLVEEPVGLAEQRLEQVERTARQLDHALGADELAFTRPDPVVAKAFFHCGSIA